MASHIIWMIDKVQMHLYSQRTQTNSNTAQVAQNSVCISHYFCSALNRLHNLQRTRGCLCVLLWTASCSTAMATHLPRDTEEKSLNAELQETTTESYLPPTTSTELLCSDGNPFREFLLEMSLPNTHILATSGIICYITQICYTKMLNTNLFKLN